MNGVACQDFIGLEVDAEHRRIRVDLTKPQTIPVIAFDAQGKAKEYFLKVTWRGLVLV